ncbi:MAG: response regulator [Lautropia sp.]
MTLCLIEDDLLLGKALANALGDAGHRVTWVRTARDARLWLANDDLVAVVLDLGLPDGDGVELLGELRRRRPDLPVVVVTARDTLAARIDGLDAGADDFLVKPFATAELLARLRAVLRRSQRARHLQPTRLVLGDLVLDEARRACRRGAREIALSPTEFALLQQLLLHADRVRTRRQLEAGALPESQGQSLDVHMSNLRRKIGTDLIRTIRGVGYLIESGGPSTRGDADR